MQVKFCSSFKVLFHFKGDEVQPNLAIMTSSIDLGPLPDPYFPKVFFTNQFLTKPRWPPADTDLSGKVAIVTGANIGLGFQCARQLLSLHLSRLIVAVRSSQRGQEAAAILGHEFPKAIIDVWLLDMSSYESIQNFAAKVDRELSRLDIVVLNAGQYNLKFKKNPSTGHEETVQVNYLSTVLLAILLLPSLRDNSPAGEPGMWMSLVFMDFSLVHALIKGQ